MDSYYDETALDEKPDVDVFISNAEFNWGKLLNNEEKEKLHAHRKRILKDKGKGKRTPQTDASVPGSNEPHDFYLTDINLTIKKVLKFYKANFVLKY